MFLPRHRYIFCYTDVCRFRALEFGMISSSRYANALPQRGNYHYAWWTVCGIVKDVIWNSSWFPTYWEVLPNLSQMSHLYVLICYSTVLIKRNILQLPRQSHRKWNKFTQEAHTTPPGQRKGRSPPPTLEEVLPGLLFWPAVAWMVQIAYSVYI